MKLPIIKVGLCLLALAGSQLQAATAERRVTFSVFAESNLAAPNLIFNATSTTLTSGDSYWSPSANWTFDSTDTAGYTVAVTNDTGHGITHWTMTSGGNSINYLLVTDRTITDTEAPAITASAGTNNNTIGNLGGRQVTPNTLPNPDENILYDKSSEDTGTKTYVVYAAIAGSELTASVEGAYTDSLTIDLTEKT